MSNTTVTVWGPNLRASETFHVHAPGCADTKRGIYRGAEQPWTITVEDREALAIDLWGDVASDNYDQGTAEWLDLCLSYLDSDVKVFPCVKGLI